MTNEQENALHHVKACANDLTSAIDSLGRSYGYVSWPGVIKQAMQRADEAEALALLFATRKEGR